MKVKSFKSLPFELYSTFNERKAVMIERFNRTIKNMIHRELTKQGQDNNEHWKANHKWLNILPQKLNKYNKVKTHSSIKVTAEYATNHPEEIRQINLSSSFIDGDKIRKHKFKIGDSVRIYKWKNLFEKGYQGYWTYEIFKIVKINNTIPITNEIEDLQVNEIKGRFYTSEL